MIVAAYSCRRMLCPCSSLEYTAPLLLSLALLEALHQCHVPSTNVTLSMTSSETIVVLTGMTQALYMTMI